MEIIKQKEIIFWRHGQAGWGASDFQRNLTNVGHYQAESVSQWLHDHAIHFPAYTSQALRAQQTIAYYSKQAKIIPAFNPDLPLKTVLQGLRSIDHAKIVIVGHLPWIAGIANHLLNEDQFNISFQPCELYHLILTVGKKWEIKDHFLP